MKPYATTMVKLVLGETCAKKVEQISLPDDTVKRRIVHMSLDVKQQVINFFAFQVDEITDVQWCIKDVKDLRQGVKRHLFFLVKACCA